MTARSSTGIRVNPPSSRDVAFEPVRTSRSSHSAHLDSPTAGPMPSTAVFNAGSSQTNYAGTLNPTAGQITSLVGTSVSGSARQTQFSLKLLF